MPHKNSGKEERTPATVTLRRSLRFLQVVLFDPEHPKTPNPDQQRRTRIRSSATSLSSTGKKTVNSRRRSHRSNSKEGSQKLDDSKTVPRRSRRLTRCADECNAETLPSSSSGRNGEFERRVTRSSYCRDVDNNAEKVDHGGFTGNVSHSCSSSEGMTVESVKLSKRFKGKSLKNKLKLQKRSWDNNLDRDDTLAFDGRTNEGALSIIENQVLDEELSQKHVDRITNGIDVTTEAPINGRDVNKMQKKIGVKRSRNQLENILDISQGWTKDQELALERAYLEAKPTPHFWKKVSRLVPGKSAQECFDKIHGSHLTPPQPRIRSRARVNSQNSTLSASKLLNASSPTTKRPKSRKQKSHVIQRTLRHMLQNQYEVKQNSESDLFSVLEPTFTPFLNLNTMLTTPDRSQDTSRSSVVHKKSISRFSSSYGATLVSPPVLKQVKNKALHEKYIDLLNCRDANRKKASAKAEKVNKCEVMKWESSVERKNAIKAAKNALVFGAKDAISEFQHRQATAFSDAFNYESGDDADEDNNQVCF